MRSDLLKTFHKLFDGDAFARLDWVVIETTGLADPAPLIQSLYMDDRCREHLRMDAVVTVVDCKHFPAHLQQQRQQPLPVETTNTAGMMGLFGARNTQRPQPESSARAGAHGGVSEAVLQVSFADRVVLNKTDLVPPEEVARLAGVVARINPAAGVLACEHSAVPIEDLLNIRAFDPLRNRALQELEEREGRIAAQPILIQRDSGGKIIRKKVTVDFGSSSSSGGGGKSKMAQRGGGDGVSESGRISTVSLTCEEPLDLDAFNVWISGLLQERGADLYRSKGILSMAGHDQQFVLQCVHMIFDGERGPPWPRTGPRRSRLVFIGVDLDRAALEAQFLACRAAPAAETTSNGGGGGEKKKLS